LTIDAGPCLILPEPRKLAAFICELAMGYPFGSSRALKISLICIGLFTSGARGEPVSPNQVARPQQMPGSPDATVQGGPGQAAPPSAPSPEIPGNQSSKSTGDSVNPKSASSGLDCRALEDAAAANDVPLDFFVRLIRQESNFDPNSVSHAGAEGIAQFMPGTARWRGLANPFEPIQSLYESARWLRELRQQFGNLGLAAAAYNAGPRRVQDWLAGRGHLPGETRAYVRIITGRAAEEWARGSVEDQVDLQKGVPCDVLVKRQLSQPRPAVNAEEKTVWGPWGLQLVGNWSEAIAISDYKQLQKRFPSVLGDRAPMILKSRMTGRGSAPWYLIRVAESSRERASQLCSRLESIGGRCLVFRN
jgi:Transglycosylase SLT domain